jgi:translation initiation factor 3 subunit G
LIRSYKQPQQLHKLSKAKKTRLIMSTPKRWGDDADDSDDEDMQQQVSAKTSTGTSLSQQQPIPPTHYSRVDKQGIQVVTSYRPGRMPGQLVKTVTKQKVDTVKLRLPKALIKRKSEWKPFGQAKLDDEEGAQTTVQSKEDIMMEDPHADTDLQDEDPAQAIAGNISAFWAKQKLRQLERKYDVTVDDGGKEEGGAGGAWTQVGAAAAGGAGGRYVPPSQRGGAGAEAAGASFKSAVRTDDLNTIRVTNLSENTTEADLQELFHRFGRISRVYLAKNKETMQSRGFAFVTFVNQKDAATAMEALQGYGYDHLILKLEWAKPNTKEPGAATEFRSGYGKALAQDTTEKVSYASNLTK